MSLIRGRCHCQKIKFAITPPTDFCAHCHCESCRRTHGAAFVTWTSVPDNQLNITEGKELLNNYESSPHIFWKSCGHCFSPLFQTTTTTPGRTYIVVASLIDKLDRDPECHVSYGERVDWIQIHDDLPKHKMKASERI